MFILSFIAPSSAIGLTFWTFLVVAIAVGTLLIFLFGRWIGRVKLTLANAFWGSAIGHVLPSLVTFAITVIVQIGHIYFLLSRYLGVALVIIDLLVALVFQTVLFQIIARTQNEILRPWRAALIALIVIVGDFLIASPIVELIQRGTGG
jgi:hypothetical protein